MPIDIAWMLIIRIPKLRRLWERIQSEGAEGAEGTEVTVSSLTQEVAELELANLPPPLSKWRPCSIAGCQSHGSICKWHPLGLCSGQHVSYRRPSLPSLCPPNHSNSTCLTLPSVRSEPLPGNTPLPVTQFLAEDFRLHPAGSWLFLDERRKTSLPLSLEEAGENFIPVWKPRRNNWNDLKRRHWFFWCTHSPQKHTALLSDLIFSFRGILSFYSEFINFEEFFPHRFINFYYSRKL